MKIWYFVYNCLNKVWISKSFCSMTHIIVIFVAHHISFLPNRFSVKHKFTFPILSFFTVKSPSVTQRSVSQENAFKKSKKQSPFFRKTFFNAKIFFFYY